MIGAKNLLLPLVFAIVLVFGCHHVDSLNGDTGPIECNLGEYSGDFTISPQSDVATLAGYTSISGDLDIEWFLEDLGNEDLSYTDLSDLTCLTSVGDDLYIESNSSLTSLDGLSGITSVGGELAIYDNPNLPDCEACDLLAQLTSVPSGINVGNNLDDFCTPVPDNCP